MVRINKIKLPEGYALLELKDEQHSGQDVNMIQLVKNRICLKHLAIVIVNW
jgi:hypothetical protein